MGTQPAQVGPILPAAGPGTRASNVDRDAAAGLLNEAFAEGRLTADEHDQRLSAAYAARSWQQLHSSPRTCRPRRALPTGWRPGCSRALTRACCARC
jgi:uncharacterized protein DUF1707